MIPEIIEQMRKELYDTKVFFRQKVTGLQL